MYVSLNSLTIFPNMHLQTLFYQTYVNFTCYWHSYWVPCSFCLGGIGFTNIMYLRFILLFYMLVFWSLKNISLYTIGCLFILMLRIVVAYLLYDLVSLVNFLKVLSSCCYGHCKNNFCGYSLNFYNKISGNEFPGHDMFIGHSYIFFFCKFLIVSPLPNFYEPIVF